MPPPNVTWPAGPLSGPTSVKGAAAAGAANASVAAARGEVLRPGDTVARFGGGFAVLCEGIADEAHARASRARAGAFLAPFEVDGLRGG